MVQILDFYSMCEFDCGKWIQMHHFGRLRIPLLVKEGESWLGEARPFPL